MMRLAFYLAPLFLFLSFYSWLYRCLRLLAFSGAMPVVNGLASNYRERSHKVAIAGDS